MAKSSIFQTSQQTNVIIGTEDTFGTKAATDATRIHMPVTSYSFSEVANHTLAFAPFRAGAGGATQSTEMVKAQRHDRMYEITLEFMGSAQAISRICETLYGDSSNPHALIGSMPTTSNINGSTAVPVTIYFDKGSASAANTAISFKTCMCTSFTISGDIGGNGGVIMGSATFVTGFNPDKANIAFSGGTETTITAQTAYFNMHDLSATTITPSGGSAEDLVLFSFELNIERAVNRVGFDTASNGFAPLGYVVGGYEVTGSMTVKRDAESDAAITYADTAEPVCAISISDGTFQIEAPKAIIDQASINFDDDGFKSVIPFRCTYDAAATSNSVVDIHTA
mgnify:FL=1|tara:strand:+ start:21 stop:1037 length:1017 start_codon:yes stop_codon:yes gene_type:complete